MLTFSCLLFFLLAGSLTGISGLLVLKGNCKLLCCFLYFIANQNSGTVTYAALKMLKMFIKK